MPSRTRSLIWVEAALPLLEAQGFGVPDIKRITDIIESRTHCGEDHDEDCDELQDNVYTPQASEAASAVM